MDRQQRKTKILEAGKAREKYAKLADDTARTVAAAVRALKERYGAHATPALIAGEVRRIRSEALSADDMRAVRELLVQLNAAEQSRPNLTDRRRMLPRRPRAVPFPEVPKSGYMTEADQAQHYAAVVHAFTQPLHRLADLIELQTYSPDELAREAHEAAAEGDHDRFARTFRELHRSTRSGPDADGARSVVNSLLADLPPPADLAEQLSDLDALARMRTEIVQSLHALSTGDDNARTAEASRLIDEQGEDAYHAQRATERARREGKPPLPTPTLIDAGDITHNTAA